MQKEKQHLKQTLIALERQIKEDEARIEGQKELISDLNHTFNDELLKMDKAEIADMKTKMANCQEVIAQNEKAISFKKKQLKKPYFGRINFKPYEKMESEYYIGLGHIQDDKDILCCDWRAPISSMYYDFDVGEANYEVNNEQFFGEITLKRQYKIEDGKLVYFLDTNETINDEILQTVLSQNTSAHMKQIVATIQKEQNKLIRADEYRNFLVQGVAGSGKTSIALHRASYLLYKHRDDFKHNDILIISPSNLFSNYISEVLPELGEENVLEMTFAHIGKLELDRELETREEIVDRICKKKEQSLFDCVAYKSSFAYLKDLRDFLENVFAKLFEPNNISFKSLSGENNMLFTKEEISKLYYETYGKLDVKDRIEYIAEYFADRFNLKEKEAFAIKERIKTILYKMFPILDIYKINELFLTRQELEFEDIGKVSYDDIAGLMIIKDYLFGFSQKYKTKYVIIDEMQDFSPAHFYIFNKLWDCAKIILGDINQCIEKRLGEVYLDELSTFLNAKYVYLKKTYRSTKQITEFCNKIINLQEVTVMSREGEPVSITKTKDMKKAIKDVVENYKGQFGHTAIICRSFEEANNLYNELKNDLDVYLVKGSDNSFDSPLIITTASTSKGIEFDHVIIPNVDSESYKGALGKNLLYVASSRALHKLDILYSGEISPLIDNQN